MTDRPCHGSSTSAHQATQHDSLSKAPHYSIQARNINVPWGLAWLPNGVLLVGQRDKARVLAVNPNTGARHVARNMKGVVPNGDQGGEAGMLGIALSPNFKTNHFVYAYYSSAVDNRIAG